MAAENAHIQSTRATDNRALYTCTFYTPLLWGACARQQQKESFNEIRLKHVHIYMLDQRHFSEASLRAAARRSGSEEKFASACALSWLPAAFAGAAAPGGRQHVAAYVPWFFPPSAGLRSLTNPRWEHADVQQQGRQPPLPEKASTNKV